MQRKGIDKKYTSKSIWPRVKKKNNLGRTTTKRKKKEIEETITNLGENVENFGEIKILINF